MITGIDFVALPVADMARAKAFYVDTFGLRPTTDGDGWVEFDLGDGPALALIDPIKMGAGEFAPVTTGGVAIAIPEFEAMSEKLKAAGRLTNEPFESPVCHGAFLLDSEGNTIMIHRRKEEAGRDRLIDFVFLPIQNMARAKAFYADVFGMTPDSGQGDGWAEYVLPDGSALALGDVKALGMDFAPAATGSVALHAPDLEEVFDKVKAAGFAVGETPMETPVCFMGFSRDSEGNGLVIHRHK